jgi:predicted Kef-type K+ transport protein
MNSLLELWNRYILLGDGLWPVLLILFGVALSFGVKWIRSRKTYAKSIALIALGLAAACYAWSLAVAYVMGILSRDC